MIIDATCTDKTITACHAGIITKILQLESVIHLAGNHIIIQKTDDPAQITNLVRKLGGGLLQKDGLDVLPEPITPDQAIAIATKKTLAQL